MAGVNQDAGPCIFEAGLDGFQMTPQCTLGGLDA